MRTSDYYPFGLQYNAGARVPAADGTKDQSFLYNGKELQDELSLNWYDYGARIYAGDWKVGNGRSAGGKEQKMDTLQLCVAQCTKFE